MSRQTSIKTYEEMEASGILGDRKWEIYKILFRYGPLTRSQVFKHIPQNRNPHSSARLTELRDMGVIFEVDEVKCPITGKTVILWDVTKEMPRKLKKKIKCSHCDGRGHFVQQEEQHGY